MFRQCTEVVDHQAIDSAGSSPYHFAEPKASSCHDLVRSLSQQDNKDAGTSKFRGDVPPKKAKSPLSSGVDDSGHFHEATVGSSQGYFSGTTADYSSNSYRAKIATFSSGISEAYTKPLGLQRATFKGGTDETDRGHVQKPWNLDKYAEPVESPNAAVHRDQITSIEPNQWKPHLQIPHEKVIKPDKKEARKVVDCYRKTSYAVLIGNTVRVYDTKMYASLPLHNKCMVKERIKDASGNTRVKMSLKTLKSRLV